jgi:ubiquinone/menaquinone biosynthesis C-methylase UbiE
LKTSTASLHSRLRKPINSKIKDINPLTRFSDRVEDYVRYRPSYPSSVIEFLAAKAGLSRAGVVADIGSGTGIFTRLLLGTGAKVFAVEPNDAMKASAEVELGHRPNFRSVKGTAEATGLPDASVSLITSAQAFHWFEPVATRNEFRRITSAGGFCALIWNTMIADKSDFGTGYERIKEESASGSGRVLHEHVEKSGQLDAVFGPGNWRKYVFENSQKLDLQGLKGRMLSSSYAPKEGHPKHKPMIAALEKLFDRCQENGHVRIEYSTDVFLGRIA